VVDAAVGEDGTKAATEEQIAKNTRPERRMINDEIE
jgi:hypothetical protein